jgi:hypothetical protein
VLRVESDSSRLLGERGAGTLRPSPPPTVRFRTGPAYQVASDCPASAALAIVRRCLRSGCGAAADVARSTIADPGMIPCRRMPMRRSMIVRRGIRGASGAGGAPIVASWGTRSISSGETSRNRKVRAAAPARKVRRFPQPALAIGADVRSGTCLLAHPRVRGIDLHRGREQPTQSSRLGAGDEEERHRMLPMPLLWCFKIRALGSFYFRSNFTDPPDEAGVGTRTPLILISV